MLDIFLNDGDLYIGENGDITLTNSVRQAARVRLQWFLAEWRLGPTLGLPYFEEVFIKNPNTQRIKNMITNTLFEIDNVDDVRDVDVKINSETRTGSISFTLIAGDEVIQEEVALNG